jgi:hypothetical protein
MSCNRLGFLERHGAVHWRFRFLVALPSARDLLLCAKHLFVVAIAVEWQIAPAEVQSYARQVFDNWCCRYDPHSAVRPNGWRPASTLGVLLIPALPFRGAVERGIPGPDLGTWRSPSGQVHRSRKHAATKQRR